MKKRLLSLMLMVITVTLPTTLLAQATAGDEAAEPYAVLSEDNTVLTFYYDEKKTERNGIAIGSYGPGNYEPWYENRTTLTTAVFDESFANDTTLTSTAYWFHECIKLTEIKGLEYLKTDKVTDMRNMFYGCSKLTTLDVSHLKTDNVTNMKLMFYYCSGLTSLDVTGFNTENVTDMGSMFNNCSGLTSLDISSFRTEKVKDMIQMFYQCYNLTTIYAGNSWSTVSVTADYGYHMFTDCTALVGGMGTTYDENHVDFTYAHIDEGPSNPGYLTEKLDYNDGDLFTAKTIEGVTLTFVVTNASEKKCFVASNDRNTYMDTSTTGVVTIPSIARGYTVEALSNGAFKGCASVTEFKLPETLVLIECDAFRNCTGLTTVHIPASVTGIENQPLPWPGCTGITSITVDPENPIFDSRDNCNAIFTTADSTLYVGCKVSTIPESTRSIGHSAFDSMGELPALVLPAGLRSITAYAFWACSFPSVTSYIEEPFETSCVWDHLPEECPLYVPKGKVDAYRALSEWNNFTTIVEIGSSITPEPYAVLSEDNTVLTFYYDEKKTARAGIDINSSNLGDSPTPYGTATSAVFDASFANYYPTSTAYWFQNCSALTSISGIDNLKTDDVTNMSWMFECCFNLEELDLSNFNTSNVTEMYGMFLSCQGLKSLNVSSFNTSKVVGMNQMFCGLSNLTNLDLSNFDTSNVRWMYAMFADCPNLTSLDISSFNSALVSNMGDLFSNCVKLKTIYVGDGWATTGVEENGDHVFDNCPSLVGGMGTVYDANRTDYTYAHIDGGVSNPGYLTDINGSTLNDGDTFTAVNSDGIELRYRVISAADKTCQVGDKADSNTLSPDDIASAVDTTVVGIINVPEQANGYKVVRVGYQAFVNCRNVTEVVLPNTVTELYLYSFAYSGIKRFTLPRSVSIIHYAALTETDSLETIIVDSENPVFDSRNNCNAIIETASNTLVRGCITSFVPDGITAIGSGAFLSCCAHDWTIELPNSVTRIETQAFNSCDLTDIKLPNNLQYVGYSAFGGSKLTSVVIPASVTEMGIGAFSVNSLTSLVVDEANSVFDSRDNCNAIIETATNTLVCGSNVTIIPNSVTAIGRYAFSELWNLKTITLPSSITRIDDHAFWYSNLDTIISLIEKPFEISDKVFHEDLYKRCELYVPAGTVDAYRSTSGWNLFQNILEINPSHGGPEPYAVLSDNNTVLTFYYDDQKSARGGLDIGPFSYPDYQAWYAQRESVTKAIFDPSFANDTTLTSTSYWFYGCNNMTLIEGIQYLHTENVTSMDYMFTGCSNLNSLDVGNFNTQNVKSFSFTFYNCSMLTNLDVKSFNTQNVVNMTQMFANCSRLTSLEVGNFNTSNVTSMAAMFSNCSQLTNLEVSSFNTQKVTNMNSMFLGCSGLTNLDVSEFNTDNVSEMIDMFSGCSGLVSLDLSSFNTKRVTSMSEMFFNCSNLTTIYVGSGWTTTSLIDGTFAMFLGCTNLVGGMGTVYDANHLNATYAHIDGGPSNPGYFTDKNAPVISDDIIQFADANVKAICVQNWDTNGDGELSKTEAESVTDLGGVFKDQSLCTMFDELRFFISLAALGEDEFRGCKLTSIILPPSLQSIGRYAFSGTKLTTITIPASVTFIDGTGLNDDEFLNFYVDKESNSFCSIDGVLFSKDSTLLQNYPIGRLNESYTIPNTVTTIGRCSFYGSHLRSVTIPEGVKRINHGAFRYCQIETIDIPNTVEIIEGENFQYCGYLTSAFIPSSVSFMGDDVLSACTSLLIIDVDPNNQYYTSIDGVLYSKNLSTLCIYPAGRPDSSYTIPDHVTTIDDYAFDFAKNLVSLVIPRGVTSIGHLNFSNNSSLMLVTVYWKEPITISSYSFNTKTVKNGTLYVPYGTKTLYEVSDGWKEFENIVEMAPEVDVKFDSNGVLAVNGSTTLADALSVAGGTEEVAKTITAIVWNSTASLTNDDLQGLDNPNMLIYVKDAAFAPANRDNVVIGDFAKNIILADVESGNNNFYCPQEFTAEMISYTHEYRQQTEIGVSRGWESIALPFTVQTMMHEKNGLIAPFGNDASTKHFWLRQLSENGLKSATVIEGNTPYLISMPNSDDYPAEFIQAGRVTFSAQDAVVPVTHLNGMEAPTATGGMIMFLPCFQSQSADEQVYALNVGEQRDGHPEGSIFVANYRSVRPFEAFTVHHGDGPAPQYISVFEMNGGTTGIEDVERGMLNVERGTLNVERWYDLNGRKLQQKPTRKGVYILNGSKVEIK